MVGCPKNTEGGQEKASGERGTGRGEKDGRESKEETRRLHISSVSLAFLL